MKIILILFNTVKYIISLKYPWFTPLLIIGIFLALILCEGYYILNLQVKKEVFFF